MKHWHRCLKFGTSFLESSMSNHFHGFEMFWIALLCSSYIFSCLFSFFSHMLKCHEKASVSRSTSVRTYTSVTSVVNSWPGILQWILNKITLCKTNIAAGSHPKRKLVLKIIHFQLQFVSVQVGWLEFDLTPNGGSVREIPLFQWPKSRNTSTSWDQKENASCSHFQWRMGTCYIVSWGESLCRLNITCLLEWF